MKFDMLPVHFRALIKTLYPHLPFSWEILNYKFMYTSFSKKYMGLFGVIISY